MELNARERRAIEDLQRLARRWPKTLMLFSASGTLCVMPNVGAGSRGGDGHDESTVIATIDIPNDGGDW
jgi:hypothetical protein